MDKRLYYEAFMISSLFARNLSGADRALRVAGLNCAWSGTADESVARRPESCNYRRAMRRR